jgi:hypothetical protein
MLLQFIPVLIAYALLPLRVLAGVIATVDVPIDPPIAVRGPPVVDEVGPYCYLSTVLVDGGNPHINYYNEQVTPTVSGCDQQDTCTTGASQSTSFSWSLNFGTGGGSPIWISGGFGVSKTVTNGVNEGCSAGPPNQNVCLWYQQAYVAYTVIDVWNNVLCGGTHSPYIMWSPTNGNACGLGYYCVVDDCRSMGEGYWTLSGPAGAC